MTDQFFVDADGLDGGRDGFDGKSAELRTLAQRVQSLANPGRIRDAAGNDKNGNEFSTTHIQSAAEIYNGINAWALAVEATRDAIGDMATSFREADQGAYDGSNALFKNFTDLNHKVQKADADAPPTEYQRGVRIRGKLLGKAPEAEDGGGWTAARSVRARIPDRGKEPLPEEETHLRRLSVERPLQHKVVAREGEVVPLEPAKVFVRSERPAHAVEDSVETPEGEVRPLEPTEAWLPAVKGEPAGWEPAKSIPAQPPITPDNPVS
ncbi:hypothetical protein L3Q65_20810 [Amycolatopsis sp. FU40]|uniref:hypothetical protein n=1 Tax=Amycolatopsis sp. FU40 TaxID=2914159 RepID=UPI001F2D0991|nr:hypothetical protein [Amycolatopsis sp. FU40]UKD59060.1 hypothetical protein L3Q65_20810 [Amycolatopsis sp. FU40]